MCGHKICIRPTIHWVPKPFAIKRRNRINTPMTKNPEFCFIIPQRKWSSIQWCPVCLESFLYIGCLKGRQTIGTGFPEKFFENLKKNFLGVILCEKSIPRIPEAWKRFLDPDSGNGVGVLKRKSNIFEFLWENRRFLGFSRRGIDCTHSRTVKALPWPCFRDCKYFL